MADTQQISFSYSLVDSLGTKGTMISYALMDPTVTISDISAQWEALGALLDVVTGCQVLKSECRLSFLPTWEGAKTAPAAGSVLEQTAAFNFPVTATGKTASTDVPGWLTANITGGKVNYSGTGVTAFVAALAGTFTGGVITNASYQAIGASVDSYIAFRKHRRQLGRTSREPAPA